jgi:hypothetical protein
MAAWARRLAIDRGVRGAAALGQGCTGLGSIKSSRFSYLGARRRAAACRSGRVGKQAPEQAWVVGQAGSEQIRRAARSHNLLERHVDSIKERRLWRRLGLKVSTMERGRLSRDA